MNHFPLRYGERITFRVWSEQSMQHEARVPSPLCGGARHSLYTHVHTTGHTRTQTNTERPDVVCRLLYSLFYRQILRLHDAVLAK